jgi:putative CocE/NonD family hydrolase
MRVGLLAVLLTLPLLAGCLDGGAPKTGAPLASDPAPFLGYQVRDPDPNLQLVEHEALLDGADGVQIHVRIKRPDVAEPVPVIVQFTPYTAGVGSVGQNPLLNTLAEPAGCAVLVGACESTFDVQFVRRGFAFAYGDVRGTGDSSGCLDLRGKGDVADAAKLIAWLGTQEWSNGKVGFIGASYPGSEAHIAAIAEAGAKTGHLGGVIPVVASTSFYHYHHNDGVPYNGNHALGGTNTGYTSNAIAPTINPQNPNYLTKYLEELTCPTPENVVTHGGLDQSGAYYEWWQERNLRGHARNVTVPVLMAQGLADWNVKPDHIAQYYNDLAGPKTLIAGQWGHQYPRSKGDCGAYNASTGCDPNIPWGNWWAYATAFFDTTLRGTDTGMFTHNVAWVQDNAGAWHRSAEWPLQQGRAELRLHLQPDGRLSSTPYDGDASAEQWVACPHDQVNRGTPLAVVEEALAACDDEAPVEQLVFDSEPFAEDTLLSGVGLVHLRVQSTAPTTHLVVVLQTMRGGEVVAARENYGYLNPLYRNGLETPEPLPADGYTVAIDLYPQEDLVRKGESLRLIVRSNDEGRTIESYDPGFNSIQFAAANENVLWLPLRPAAFQGVRL